MQLLFHASACCWRANFGAVSIFGVNTGFDRALARGKVFLADCKEDDLTGLAAELSFRAFLALFPFVLFLVTLGAFISSWAHVRDPAQTVLDVFGDRLPPDASSVVRTQVQEVVTHRSVRLLSISVLAAIWTAGGAAGALMKAVNRVLDLPETRPFWEKTALAIGLVVLGSLAVFGGVAALVFTEGIVNSVGDALGVSRALNWTIGLLRLPILAVLIVAVTEVVYWLAPNSWGRLRFFSPGSLAFALGWTVFTFGFALYIQKAANYNATYGATAGVAIMLVWFYVSALLLLAGAELNEFLHVREAASSPAEAALTTPVAT